MLEVSFEIALDLVVYLSIIMEGVCVSCIMSITNYYT